MAYVATDTLSDGITVAFMHFDNDPGEAHPYGTATVEIQTWPVRHMSLIAIDQLFYDLDVEEASGTEENDDSPKLLTADFPVFVANVAGAVVHSSPLPHIQARIRLGYCKPKYNGETNHDAAHHRSGVIGTALALAEFALNLGSAVPARLLPNPDRRPSDRRPGVRLHRCLRPQYR